MGVAKIPRRNTDVWGTHPEKRNHTTSVDVLKWCHQIVRARRKKETRPATRPPNHLYPPTWSGAVAPSQIVDLVGHPPHQLCPASTACLFFAISDLASTGPPPLGSVYETWGCRSSFSVDRSLGEVNPENCFASTQVPTVVACGDFRFTPRFRSSARFKEPYRGGRTRRKLGRPATRPLLSDDLKQRPYIRAHFRLYRPRTALLCATRHAHPLTCYMQVPRFQADASPISSPARL